MQASHSSSYMPQSSRTKNPAQKSPQTSSTQSSVFIQSSSEPEGTAIIIQEKNLPSTEILNELFEAFSKFKTNSNPHIVKQNKARFVHILAKIEKIAVANNNFEEIISYIEQHLIQSDQKFTFTEHDKLVLIEYIKIKLDKQNIFNIVFENRYRIETKEKFGRFLNGDMKNLNGAVLQDIFQLFFDFDITPPEQIFQFFNCFFKEGVQGPIFLSFLIENIFDERQVFLLFKLMRVIQAAAKKEMDLELYETSFVGTSLKQTESEIIFQFYEEPKSGEEPLALTRKDEPLEKLVDDALRRIKAIFQKIESGSIDAKNLTSGVPGSTANLGYNWGTDTGPTTAPIAQNIPGISAGSFADNGTQDALLMGSFFYAAYAYGKWRKELGRAPTRELAFELKNENKLLNKILLKMQTDSPRKQFSAENAQVLTSTLKQSGGIAGELETGSLLSARKGTPTTDHPQENSFLPEATTELRLKKLLENIGKNGKNVRNIQQVLESLKNEFIKFHGGVQYADKGTYHYLIVLNTLVFECDKFQGTFYSHLMAKAKTQEERALIKELWPLPTERCRCSSPNSTENPEAGPSAPSNSRENSTAEPNEGPHRHINDLIKYSNAQYDGTDGVENYFQRVIQKDSAKWADRVDAELCFHNLRLIITKNPNLTPEMRKNLLSRLNYYLELGAEGPFAKLCIKRKNLHREILTNFAANQGFAAKRHVQTVQSIFHAAKNLGSMTTHVAVGTLGWMWAACLNPALEYFSFGNTRTLKNLKLGLQMELAWADYEIANAPQIEVEGKHTFQQMQGLVERVYNAQTNSLSLSDITEHLNVLKEKNILASILEDHHCKDRPLIWIIMDKLSKAERDQFLRNYYYKEEEVKKEIKKTLEKKTETKLSDTDVESYLPHVSAQNQFLTYIHSQLSTINEVADNALFVSFRVKAYLLSLKDKLGENSDEYKLCQMEFKKFIRSSKEVSSPMRVICKRTALSALWRKMLHRAIAAGSWGFVSNAFTASIGVLGGATLFGAKAAFLFSNPGGWAVLGIAGLILLGACGARLLGYSVSDIWGYTSNTKHNRFMEKMLEGDLEETTEIDKQNVCKSTQQTAVEHASGFINDKSLTKKEREKRLFFLFNEIELTMFNRESCLARLQDMLAIIEKIQDESRKAFLLCILLKKVETADGGFRFLQQANSIHELRDLSKNFLGGTAASLGSIASMVLSGVTFGLSSIATEFVVAGVCVAAGTVGDGISTHLNSGRFDRNLLKTPDYYAAVGLIQTALAQCLRSNKNEIDTARSAADQLKRQQQQDKPDLIVLTTKQGLWLKIDRFCRNREDLMGKIRYLDEKEAENERRSQVVPCYKHSNDFC